MLELARVGDGISGALHPATPAGRVQMVLGDARDVLTGKARTTGSARRPRCGGPRRRNDDRLPVKANQTLEVDDLDTDALRLPFLDRFGRHAPTRDGHDRDLRGGAGTPALPMCNTYLSSDSAPMQWSLLAIQQSPRLPCQTPGQPGPRCRWGNIDEALCVERIRGTPTFIPGRCAKSPPALRMLPSQYPQPRVRHLWPCSCEAVRLAGLPVAGSR